MSTPLPNYPLPTNIRNLPRGLAIASQSAEFWRRLSPELSLSPRPVPLPAAPVPGDLRARLVESGYLRMAPLAEAPLLSRLAAAMDRIARAGLPPAFIGVYDEVWQLAAAMQPVLDAAFGGTAALVPNFWARHGGDAQPPAPACRRRPGNGVHADGTPRSLTLWLPLTRATPDNGCVYLVPAGQDRAYGRPGGSRAETGLPGIRALPARPGEALLWTGETYHWQALPDRRVADGDLLSLNWEFQCRCCPPLEGAVIDGNATLVPFETRLAIIARQMPRHVPDLRRHSVWGALQQTLANRFPLRAAG